MHVSNVGELQAYAVRFAMELQPHKSGATVVTLSGELGAGKTSFAQAVAKTFGVAERITSPTFVIEKIYQLEGQRFRRLIHIDAYRSESPHELEALGFRELLHDPKDLILLEWPEKVATLLPKDAVKIRFDIHGDGRTISIDGGRKKN